MTGVFRQPLGIPDEILPDAWRNTLDDEYEKNCSSEDPSCKAKEKNENSYNPCTTNYEDNYYYSYYDYYENYDIDTDDFGDDDTGDYDYYEDEVRTFVSSRRKIRGM